MTTEWLVRTPVPADRARWRELYRGYADFYRTALTEQTADRVWRWILDPAQVTECLLVCDAAGLPVGLAHYRGVPRTLEGDVAGFLDDLYVTPAARGGGAAGALLDRLAALAAQRGWPVVQWITADDNYRARALYDRRALRTRWVTYEMAGERP